jgi:membrane protease YdiL (CAAX protease family)
MCDGHAISSAGDPPPSAQSGRGGLIRILIGYVVAYGAFESTAQLAASLDLAWRQILIALAGFVAVLAAEMVLFRQAAGAALVRLGLGRPSAWSLLVALGLSLLLLAAYPAIAWLTGARFALQPGWPLLAVGIFLMNGISEETIYRGYLFRHLREGRTFRRAVLLGIVLHAAAHLPILATAGVVVGLSAVLVSVATFPTYAYLFERGRDTVWAPALIHFASDTIKLVIAAGALADPAMQTATLLWLVVIAAAPYLVFAIPARTVTPDRPARAAPP